MPGNTRRTFNGGDPLDGDAAPQVECILREPQLTGQPANEAGLCAQESGAVHADNISATGISAASAKIRYLDTPATNMRQARKRKGLKQADLANILNVRQSAVSMWETGRSNPDYDNLIKLSAALELPMEALLPKHPPPIPAEMLDDFACRRLVADWLALDPQGRQALQHIASRMRQNLSQNR